MEFKLQEKVDSRNKLVNFRATESEIKFIKEKEKRITFRVTSDEFKVLKEKAKNKNLTVSDLIRTILADNLK